MHSAACLIVLALLANPGESAPAPTVQVSERPTYVSPDGTTLVQIILEGESAAVSRITALPGAKIPVHTHDGADEFLVIEAGAGEMTLGERHFTVSAGQAVRIPRGTPHSFRHAGKGPLRALQTYAPAGPEQRFKKWKVLK